MSASLASVRDPVVLSVHSMTPELNGQLRTWPISLSFLGGMTVLAIAGHC
mgnify:CR=1 FL=1